MSGDIVLFQRGATFRISEPIQVVSGVKYGAYNSGAKPVISGSVRNYAEDTALWNTTGTENVWKLANLPGEAGVMTFDNDRAVGIRKFSTGELRQNGDYYYDMGSHDLYLYFNNGNPAEYFETIEIGTTEELITGTDPSKDLGNVEIHNLELKYASKMGINLSKTSNIKIANCKIGWIGGAISHGTTRFGNGIQLWARSSNSSVENCHIYQIYDAGITFQGSYGSGSRFQNLTFSGNLMEYCSMNFEYWATSADVAGDPTITDITFSDNMVRFGGYGWGALERSSLTDQAMILAWGNWYKNFSVSITNNVFDCADCNFIWSRLPGEQSGLTISGNTYYQRTPSGNNPEVTVIRSDSSTEAKGQSSFEAAIWKFDSNPSVILWLAE